MSVGDVARQQDVDRLDRAIEELRKADEELRKELREDGWRRDKLREADQRAHLAEHKTFDEQIDHKWEQHETRHTTEAAGAAERRNGSWVRGLALGSALAGVVSAATAALAYMHGR